MKSSPRYTWFKSLASLLFLLGYLVSSVSFETLHQAVHHHDHSEIHSEKAEADACHRAIYHGETSHDCEHKSHLAETEEDCELCIINLPRTDAIFFGKEVANLYSGSKKATAFSSIQNQGVVSNCSARAPPFSV